MRKYRTGITEKRLNDKRFQKTEDLILAVFFAMRGYISMSKLAVKVGVARSTIYSHHPSSNDIMVDYRKYILRKYKRAINKAMNSRSMQMRTAYRQMLLFILQNRKIFEILLRGQDRLVFVELVKYMAEMIQARMKLPKNNEVGIEIYTSAIVEIIQDWGRNGFPSSDMVKVLTNILYITDNARMWLKPIAM